MYRTKQNVSQARKYISRALWPLDSEEQRIGSRNKMAKISPLLVENADAPVMNNTVTSTNAFDAIVLQKKIEKKAVCEECCD